MASHMFVSRQLPTCKMLIRRNVYGFMLNVQNSSNFMNSIVRCGILFTCSHVHISSVETLETVIVYTSVLVGNHIQTVHIVLY